MKKTRWALLALLVAAIAVVVAGYQAARKRNLLLAPSPPARLPEELNSIAKNWSWSHSSGDSPAVEVKAREYRQIKESTRLEITGVEIKIFHKTGESYDLVRSERAEFDQAEQKLYSDGEVAIVLGMPAKGPPPPGKKFVEIRTSGLTYENKTGISSTDKPVHFRFEDGEGSSVGVHYDSANRYLWMKSNVEISGRMRIRSGELHYREAEQKVELRPWCSLERGSQRVDASSATIFLEERAIKKVDAVDGKGFDIRDGREVRFNGKAIEVNVTPQRTIATANATGNAEVIMTRAGSGITKVNSGRVTLEFITPEGAAESELSVANAHEQARLESIPAATSGRPQPETKVLTADMLKLVMRPGGEDVETIQTMAAGRLEFIPNQPGQWKRTLTAERMTAQYLPGNRIETLRGMGNVHLRSDPPPPSGAKPGAPPPSPRLTWSQDLQAFFDPQNGQMRELRQWSGFRYQEGERQARAAGARFEASGDRVYLDNSARVWDTTSLTTADRLMLDQKEDRLEAEGTVTSTHNEKPSPMPQLDQQEALFSRDRPIYATAHRLQSRQRNRLLEYRGSARLWQDGNSIQAEEITLDRQAKTLSARGNVVSVLVEGEQKPGGRLVTITADSMDYTDESRRAFYRGNVLLRRERMNVRANELEAFLRAPSEVKEGTSRLERAYARGKVEIVETAVARNAAPRRGYGEQADYFSDEGKVILRGGDPRIEQPDRGFTRGAQLTYYIDDARLLVSGRPGVRSQTQQKLKRN